MSRTPIVKQYAWISVLPQLLVLALAIVVTHQVLRSPALNTSILIGALIYLAYSFAVRNLLTKSHRKGIYLSKAGKFADAIPEFDASYEFFTSHLWVDRWRFLTMLSSSATSYREMALCNIGFCYGQIGDGRKSKEYYERALQEFPNSVLAIAALNIIQATENAATPKL